jgi:hypothetical protein
MFSSFCENVGAGLFFSSLKNRLPLLELHDLQTTRMLLGVFSPPLDRGTM